MTYAADLAHLADLEAAVRDPDDPFPVFQVQLTWVFRHFMANIGCCPDCLARFDERYPRFATP